MHELVTRFGIAAFAAFSPFIQHFIYICEHCFLGFFVLFPYQKNCIENFELKRKSHSSVLCLIRIITFLHHDYGSTCTIYFFIQFSLFPFLHLCSHDSWIEWCNAIHAYVMECLHFIIKLIYSIWEAHLIDGMKQALNLNNKTLMSTQTLIIHFFHNYAFFPLY